MTITNVQATNGLGMNLPPLITAKQAREWLGLKSTCFYEQVKRGHLPQPKIKQTRNSKWLRADFDVFLSKQTTKP